MKALSMTTIVIRNESNQQAETLIFEICDVTGFPSAAFPFCLTNPSENGSLIY